MSESIQIFRDQLYHLQALAIKQEDADTGYRKEALDTMSMFLTAIEAQEEQIQSLQTALRILEAGVSRGEPLIRRGSAVSVPECELEGACR